MKDRITKKLSDNLTIISLEIIDKSHLHIGHFGHNENNKETHFEVIISAQELKNKKLIAAHKIIKKLLKDEFENGLHSLSIKLK